MRNLETILVNSYPSKSIVGRSGAGRSVGEVVDREDDAEAVDRREVLRDLGVVGPVGGERRGFSWRTFWGVSGPTVSPTIASASSSGELSAMESGLRRGVIAEAIAHDANRSAFGRKSRVKIACDLVH